jgi:hypothetical protein
LQTAINGADMLNIMNISWLKDKLATNLVPIADNSSLIFTSLLYKAIANPVTRPRHSSSG